MDKALNVVGHTLSLSHQDQELGDVLCDIRRSCWPILLRQEAWLICNSKMIFAISMARRKPSDSAQQLHLQQFAFDELLRNPEYTQVFALQMHAGN